MITTAAVMNNEVMDMLYLTNTTQERLAMQKKRAKSSKQGN